MRELTAKQVEKLLSERTECLHGKGKWKENNYKLYVICQTGNRSDLKCKIPG